MNKNIKLILALVIATIVIVAFGFCVHALENRLDAPEATKEKSVAEEIVLCIDGVDYVTKDNVASYLIMGTDGTKTGNGNRQGDQGSMSDFLLLVVVNKTTGEYGFIQIDRDTISNVYNMESDEDGEFGADVQICVAHAYGETAEDGCENTVRSVSELFGGLTINGYYSINMADIGKINHIVGGVEVTVEDDFSACDSSLVKGETILLSDSQAENYLRGRMNVGDGNNTGRMRRQREYMNAYFDKAIKLIEEDNSFVNDFYDSMLDESISNMSGNEVSTLANMIRNYDSCGFLELDGEHKLGYVLGDGIEHIEFYPKTESIVSVLNDIININKVE